MKRQIILGFTGALIVGMGLVLGACNKHSFKSAEFEPGIQTLYQEHHGGEAHDSGEEHAAGEGASHDKKEEAGHKGHDSDKGHGEAPGQPAKTLFPKK